MNLLDELTQIARAFDDARVPYPVCGGIAVAVYGHVRATQGIDLLVDAGRLDEVRETLGELGYLHPSSAVPFPAAAGERRLMFRLTKVSESSHLTIDLLLAESELWAGALARRERRELESSTISVVTRADLVAMKRESGRPIDQDDIDRLPTDG